MPIAFCQPIEEIEAAIASDRVTELAAVLARLGRTGAFADPNLFAKPVDEHYARRLIWRHPQGRFVVVGMTWAPGQGTLLHDHSGLWGGELVVGGAIREQTYVLLESEGGRHRFAASTTSVATSGAVGVVAPPFEYHRIENAGDDVAHTVHVYAGDLVRSRCFKKLEDGWYESADVQLRYDA